MSSSEQLLNTKGMHVARGLPFSAFIRNKLVFTVRFYLRQYGNTNSTIKYHFLSSCLAEEEKAKPYRENDSQKGIMSINKVEEEDVNHGYFNISYSC